MDEIERLRADLSRLMMGHKKAVTANVLMLAALRRISLHDGLVTREATVKAQRKIAENAIAEYEEATGAR